MKPYTNESDLTYEMLLEHPYFRELEQEELANLIGHMDYDGYLKLEGEYSDKKAENLINNWKITKESTNYQIY